MFFLPFAILVDPLVQSAASHVPADHWFDIFQSLLSDDDPGEAVATIVQLVWTIGMLVCVLPVTITALIGGVARARSLLVLCGPHRLCCGRSAVDLARQPLCGSRRTMFLGRRASHAHPVSDRRCRWYALLADCGARRWQALCGRLDVGAAEGISGLDHIRPAANRIARE